MTYQSVYTAAIILLSILHFSQPWSLKLFCGPDDYEIVDVNNVTGFVQTSKCFNISRDTVIYSFGYNGSMTNNGTIAMIKTFLSCSDSNVFVVDWTEEANPGIQLISYPIAADSALTIGAEVGDVIAKFYNAGMSLKKLLLVGLSLGAHLMGEAGRRVFILTSKKISWIIGQDPAKPFFDSALHTKNRLDSSCAITVHIIHTNIYKYGMADATGTIDFYVNFADIVQPGCPQGVFLPFSYEGKASNYIEWVANDGAANNVTCIGSNNNTEYSGTYFLSTNAESPYARGSDGLRP